MTVTDIVSDEPRFRLKIVPLIVTAALGYGVPIAGAYAAFYAIKLFHLAIEPGGNLGWLYMQHAGQLVVALLVIAALKYTILPADYGLHWPRGKTYIWPAILWGTFFGVLMTVVDYAPQLIAHTKPDPGFPLTPGNIWGWTFFEGVYVGPTEEIPFRALLVTYLAATMPGKLRMGRFNMNWAGIIVSVTGICSCAVESFTAKVLVETIPLRDTVSRPVPVGMGDCTSSVAVSPGR